MKKILYLFSLSAIVGFALAGCGNGDAANNSSDDNKVIELSGEDTTITKGGSYRFSGQTEAITISTKEDVTIELEDVTMDVEGVAINSDKSGSVTLSFSGSNCITNSDDNNADTDSTIFCNGNMTIEGNGTVVINGNMENAIKCDGTLTFNDNVKYEITAVKDCIHGNGDIIFGGGEFTLKSEEDECIQAEGKIELNEGSITGEAAADFMKAEGDLTINGGELTVTSAEEGIESKATLTINDGSIKLSTTDDCMNAAGELIINDGDIEAVSLQNDAIDSNGKLTINGGKIYAIGLTTPEGSFDCDNNAFEINGGEIVGIGSVHSSPTACTQGTIIIAPESNETIENVIIKDEAGNEVWKYEFEDYSVYRNGENQGGEFFEGNMEKPNEEMNGNMEFPEDMQGNMEKPNEEMNGNMEFPEDMQENMEKPNKEMNGNMEFPEDMQGNMEKPNEEMNGNNEELQQNDRTMRGGGGRGGMMNGSGVNLFISTASLDKDETYEIYINGELVDKITLTEYFNTVGNINSMNGGK